MTTDERLQAMDPDPGPGGRVPVSAGAAAAADAGDGARADAGSGAGASAVEPPPPPPSTPSPAAPSSPVIADWPTAPAGSPGGIPEPGSTVGLWPAGVCAVVTFFLGFPAGLALTAASWYRLGRRGLAMGHVAFGVLLLLLVAVLPDQLSWLTRATSLLMAIYVYAVLVRARGDAARSGIVVGPGGFASGLAIAIGGWVLALLAAVVFGASLGVMGWGSEDMGAVNETGDSPAPVTRTVEPAATSADGSHAAPGPTSDPAGAAGTFGIPDLDACPTSLGEMHQAPGVEAVLPARVGGRDLSIWSVRGWCWLHLTAGDDGTAKVAPMILDEGIDVDSLQYAVAGRADVDADPPYFVFAASRPEDPDAHDVALSLLMGGAGYDRWPFDLSAFEPRQVGDRMAFVGTSDMVTQSEHQRGRPWLYQTADTMFLIVTDDDAWAEDAIGQLPCCWSND